MRIKVVDINSDSELAYAITWVCVGRWTPPLHPRLRLS